MSGVPEQECYRVEIEDRWNFFTFLQFFPKNNKICPKLEFQAHRIRVFLLWDIVACCECRDSHDAKCRQMPPRQHRWRGRRGKTKGQPNGRPGGITSAPPAVFGCARYRRQKLAAMGPSGISTTPHFPIIAGFAVRRHPAASGVPSPYSRSMVRLPDFAPAAST